MRNLFYIGITALISNFINSQTLNDLNYITFSSLNGSARYKSMAGAFGALGGDLSSITNNPAGSSVFLYNEIGASINYNSKKKAKAIVHSHSTNATALSTHNKKIPSFHYMVALAGGIDIKCAKYATYGTRELSKNILKALKNRSACLIANHGQITFGQSLTEAFELAEEVDNLAKQYIKALVLGRPKLLSLNEMKKVLSKSKTYKRT